MTIGANALPTRPGTPLRGSDCTGTGDFPLVDRGMTVVDDSGGITDSTVRDLVAQ